MKELSTEEILSLVNLTLIASGENASPIAAGLAVVASDTNRVLMIQRSLSEEDPAAGKWEFPGGKLDKGETSNEAAIREWTEETGIGTLPPGTFTSSWTCADGSYELFVYRISKEESLDINMDHEDRHVLNPDDPDGDNIEVIAWWDKDDLINNPALRKECLDTDWKVLNEMPSSLSFDNLTSLTLIETENVHYHWDPETQFYNQCHAEDGKFCSDPVSGRTNLRDSDGTPSKGGTVPEKRGKLGASLKDPHEGTIAFDGVRGYDPRTKKPVPGSDAYLEAHNIPKDVFEARPYVKYEASKTDEALNTAYPKDKFTPGKNYSKGHRLFVGTAEDKDPEQTGGYIMYKHPAPGSKHGEIQPQVRPNAPVVTNKGDRAKALALLNIHKERAEVLKNTTPQQFIKEKKLEVKQAKENLARVEKMTPETVRKELTANYEAAKGKYKQVKETSTDPIALDEARKEIAREKKYFDKNMERADKPSFKEARIESATLQLQGAENKLKSALDNPEASIKKELKRLTSENGLIKRATNAYDKTAAKYLFTPGESSARIDVSQDPQNLKNLTKGKGRIYFAMEGSIKNDAVLAAVRKEDPKAAVVNVPSVTLWQQKDDQAVDIDKEVIWFAKTHAKGREVVLIPDADGVTNNLVMMQSKALKSILQQNGAKEVLLATPPLKPGTKKKVDEFTLPSGKPEERKGIDDHLGAGRGTLGQLVYTANTDRPSYDLKYLTKAGGKEGTKISAGGIESSEKVLAAISDLAGESGIGQIPAKTMNQAAGYGARSKSVALKARERLEEHGIIKVEYVYDRDALRRGERIRNPNMSDDRVDELVKMGVIKEPHIYKRYTESHMDESPVITILKPEYILDANKVQYGTLAERDNWKPPTTFKGWTSAVTGRPDSTGLAKKQEENHKKFVTKNAARNAAVREAAKVTPGKTTKERLATKKAPPGRRLVRSAEGAKRYGVAIGQPIPLSANAITSTVLLSAVMTEEEIVEFYNQCHDENGRFCEGEDGAGKAASGKFLFGKNKIKVQEVADAGVVGTVEVDGIEAKKVYSATTKNGTEVKLYDKSGKVGRRSADMLRTQVELNERYPLNSPRHIIVEEAVGGILDGLLGGNSPVPKDTFAIVYGNQPYTYVNAGMLNVDVGKFSDGFQMPSAKNGNTKDMSYLLAHEYGHHIDFERHSNNGYNYDKHPLWNNSQFKEGLSRYGTSDARGIEGYSEAFAEWHHSEGRTQNPSSIAMARYEGWEGAESLRASGEIVSLTHQALVHFAENKSVKGIVVIESLTEDGPKVIGDFKVNEPSQADTLRADQIMDDVLKELSEGA